MNILEWCLAVWAAIGVVAMVVGIGIGIVIVNIYLKGG